MPGPSGNSVRVLDNPFPPQPVYRCVGSAGSRTNNAKRERAVGNNRTLVTKNEKETGRKASTIMHQGWKSDNLDTCPGLA